MSSSKAERRLRTIFKKWIPLLGMGNWTISIEVVPEIGPTGAPGFDAGAECVASWEYEKATIRFLEDDVLTSSPEWIESNVVHELMHCLLNELRRSPKGPNEERTAVVLTRAFMKMSAA